MRRFGQLLAVLGLALGGLLAVAMLLPLHLIGFSWLIAVGLAKLTFASALGLIGGGAVLQRLATRNDAAKRLPPPDER